jgi:hypothetical protein
MERPIVNAYVADVGDLQRRLRGFAAQMLNLRPFWPIAFRLGRRWIKEQLDSQGGWGGDPWEPLSPGYAAYKARVKPGKPMLWFDGDLRKAAFSPQRVTSATEAELRIVERKAAWHQEGTSKMPARPIIPVPLPTEAQDELRDAFADWVGEVVDRWGLGSRSRIGPWGGRGAGLIGMD